MKKRFLFASAVCCVAAIVFFRTRPAPIVEPTQRPKAETSKRMFPADSRQIFENADRMILYSIKKMPMVGKVNTFHDYPIIGKTEIPDAKTHRDLVAQLYHGVATSDGTAAGCFSPRHAIRASKGNKTVDLVICFSCLNLQVFYEGKTGRASLTETPQAFYDLVLTKAGVPLAP